MSIDRHVWAVVLTAMAYGCAGEVDGSSTVVTEDGKPHVIADVYGPSSTPSAGPLGDWTLYEVDTRLSETRTLLRLLAGGHLDATALDSKMVYDDVHGDRLVPNVTVLEGKRGTCEIANRWRMIDAHRLGILFTCDDGVGREAVFSFSASVSFFSPPVARNSDMQYRLTLDTVGGEPATTLGLPGAWSLYGFELTATE